MATHVTIRLDNQQETFLKAQAKKNKRSLRSEVEMILEDLVSLGTTVQIARDSNFDQWPENGEDPAEFGA